MEDIKDFITNNIWLIVGIVLAFVVFLFVIKLFTANKANRSVALMGLRGRGELDHSKNKLTIEYHRKFLFLFRWWTGTISYILANENLYVNYEVKRERGDRIISLDSIYHTGISMQKRRPFLLILAVIVAAATVISYVHAIGIAFTIAGIALTMLLFLLWLFQKRAVSFSILFGGVGEAASQVLTSNKDNDEIIAEFLTHTSKCALERREEISAKPLHGILNTQNNLIASLKETIISQAESQPQNGLPAGFAKTQPPIHTYNTASQSLAQKDKNKPD